MGMREGFRSGCVSIRPRAMVLGGSGQVGRPGASGGPPTAGLGLPSSEELDRAGPLGPGSPLATRPASPGWPHLATRTLRDEEEELEEQYAESGAGFSGARAGSGAGPVGVLLAAASRAWELARNSSSRHWISCCSCCGSSCRGVRKTLAGTGPNSELDTREGQGATRPTGLRSRGVWGLLLPEPALLPSTECCPSRSLRTKSTACSSRFLLRARRAGLGADSRAPLPPGAPRGRPRSNLSRDWLRGAGSRFGEMGVLVVSRRLGRSLWGPVARSSLRAPRGPLWAEEAEESLSPE